MFTGGRNYATVEPVLGAVEDDDVPTCGVDGTGSCIGVPGNPAALGSNYTTYFDFYGNAEKTAPCLSTKYQTLGTSVTNFGCCSETGGINDKRGACQNQLTINGATLATGKLPCSLVGLTKTWGVTKTWHHGGVVRENISIAPDIDVTYNGTTTKQNVIRLRITGDKVDQNDNTFPSGVFEQKPPKPSPKCNEQYCWPGTSGDSKTSPCWQQQCKILTPLTETNINTVAHYNYSNPKARVGACVATANQFGPGRFSVLARVPKTDWKEMDGRGYVFAIWTFAYSELYNVNARGDNYGPKNGYGNTLGVYSDGENTVGDVIPNNHNGYVPPNLPDLVMNDGGYYSVINHEIDIEIPSNSPQLAGGKWQNNLTWSTMNCNTWLSDIDIYQGEKPYYTQAMARAEKGTSFVSSDAGEFHLYEFDWHVDPSNPGNNSVTWYFDGKEVYTTKRFVPFYAGRLVIGPWHGWWGSNVKGTNNSVDFAFVNVDVAEITIVPQKKPQVALSIAQMYDQTMPTGSGSSKEISCGFEGFVECEESTEGSKPTCPAPPNPTPQITPKYYCEESMCKTCQPGSCPNTTLHSSCPANCSGQSQATYYCDINANSCKPCSSADACKGSHTYPNQSACTASCHHSSKHSTTQRWYSKYKWYLVGGGGVVILILVIVAIAHASKRRSSADVGLDENMEQRRDIQALENDQQLISSLSQELHQAPEASQPEIPTPPSVVSRQEE